MERVRGEHFVLQDDAVRGLGRQFWLLSAALALMGMGFQGIIQILKVLYELRLGFDAQFVGTLFAVGSISFAVACVPAGALGSRFGARAVMIMGAVLSTVGALALAATQVLPPSLRAAGPLVFEILGPAGWAFLVVNEVTALTAVTSTGNRKHAFGLKEALLGMGLFAGALVGGLLPGMFAVLLGVSTAEAEPYAYAIVTAAIISTLGFIPLWRLRPLPVVTRLAQSVSSRPPLGLLLLVCLCGFLSRASFASVRAFAPAYLDTVFQLPTSLIGAVASVGTLVAIGAALSTAQVARSRGSIFSMLVSTIAIALSILVMAVLPNWGMVAIGFIGATGMVSMWVASYQLVQMDLVAPEWRSMVAGAGSLAMSLGFGTMSLVGGRIVVAHGYRPLYLVSAGLAFAGALLIVGIFRRITRVTQTMRAQQ